jgi:hypothetical protein
LFHYVATALSVIRDFLSDHEPPSIRGGDSFQNQLEEKLGDGAGATAATMANEAIAHFQYFKLSTHMTHLALTHQQHLFS